MEPAREHMLIIEALADASCVYIETIDPQLRGLTSDGANKYKTMVSFLLMVKGIMDALLLPTHPINRNMPLLRSIINYYKLIQEKELDDNFFIEALDRSPYSLTYINKISFGPAADLRRIIDDLSKAGESFIDACSNIVQEMRFKA